MCACTLYIVHVCTQVHVCVCGEPVCGGSLCVYVGSLCAWGAYVCGEPVYVGSLCMWGACVCGEPVYVGSLCVWGACVCVYVHCMCTTQTQTVKLASTNNAHTCVRFASVIKVRPSVAVNTVYVVYVHYVLPVGQYLILRI